MGRGGIKYDSQKPLIYVILKQFPNALALVAKCSEYGHNKYIENDANWDNWKQLENAEFRYSNAMIRHAIAEGNDEESKLPHAAHAAWNALARLEKILENEKNKTKTDSC